jgi:hypothetical protein
MSFFDDGADLANKATGPGFGEPNHKFYRSRHRKRAHAVPYNEDVRRAVSGQIKGTLEGMRGLAGVGQRIAHVKDVEMGKSGNETEQKIGRCREKKDRGPPPGAVRVWIPPPPPHYIIHGQDGRLVVVDSSKEPIDSRPPPELMPRLVRPESVQKEGHRKLKPRENTHNEGNKRVGEDKKKRGSGSQWSSSSSQTAQPKPHDTAKFKRSESKGRSSTTEEIPCLALPVDSNYFMTGGLGLSSPAQSADSWESDHHEETKSNYRAPTVEDASADSLTTEQCTYMTIFRTLCEY